MQVEVVLEAEDGGVGERRLVDILDGGLSVGVVCVMVGSAYKCRLAVDTGG